MKRIDELSEGFRLKYEKFVIACDAVEEEGKWDKEQYGEMEVFYESDILGAILEVIASDGVICEKEAEYINKNFSLDYTPEQLKEIYENYREARAEEFDVQLKEGIAKLRAISEELADSYRELFLIICDIIMESDDLICQVEKDTIERFKKALQ